MFPSPRRNAPNASRETGLSLLNTYQPSSFFLHNFPPSSSPSSPSSVCSLLSPPPPIHSVLTVAKIPLSPFSQYFFSFRAVRYWARQLGNRRHFRTVPTANPHIRTIHPSTPVHPPSNPFFFPLHTALPPLLHTTHAASDNPLLLPAHSCFLLSFSPLPLVTKEDQLFLSPHLQYVL